MQLPGAVYVCIYVLANKDYKMIRLRRVDARFYAVIAVLLFIVLLMWGTSGPPKTQDFRIAAKDKLQLASGSRSDSCRNADAELKVPTARVSFVVTTQTKEEAVVTQTINSILAHTDPKFIEEIILVTEKTIIKEKLELLKTEFLDYESVVKIVHGHSTHRLANKLVVGHLAEGDIVVFIDDTVVVTDGYLQPLLAALDGHPEVQNT